MFVPHDHQSRVWVRKPAGILSEEDEKTPVVFRTRVSQEACDFDGRTKECRCPVIVSSLQGALAPRHGREVDKQLQTGASHLTLC
ncbi:Hypothetical protein NTJ_07419 [Nesidiocoris tenuis]|uniref:Kinesin motor domain-containing protein n=1 Tax=Nesidiocoris tenuis TaxID=355587 RepID=A0ABN7AQX7_9HEMI|nr:Hypothetical protein NTJ_07419 [Nesidiocoris tenuis]